MTLLGIAGALRVASTNRKLIREAGRLYGGAFVEADLKLPLYDGDLEASGIPAPVALLADQIAEAEAVVISTPEYNGAVSGVLKNALDWVSRVAGNPWADKPVAILSAAAGRAGGARAQHSLRLAVSPFRPRLLTGGEVMIAASGSAFDEDGRLTDGKSLASLQSLMARLQNEVARGA